MDAVLLAEESVFVTVTLLFLFVLPGWVVVLPVFELPASEAFFVTVTDEFVETRQFAKRANGKKIEIGNWKFTKCEYEVK